MSYKIEHIEGIGSAYGGKLRQAGITTTARLLQACADPKGSRRLAERTGLDAARLSKWAKMADLMRINGIGRQFAELLEAAGVDTVKELRMRAPASLCSRMVEVNQERKLARAVPSQKVVAGWIDQAKRLPPANGC